MHAWTVADCAHATVNQPPTSVVVGSATELTAELRRLSQLPSRIIEIEISANEILRCGIGGDTGFIEHVGATRVTRAIRSHSPLGSSTAEFLMGSVPSEIPRDYLLSVTALVEILVDWFESGREPGDLQWDLT